MTKSAGDFGVHNTKCGRDLLCIPAFAFLYLDTHKNGKQRTVDIVLSVMTLLKEVREEQTQNGISAFVFTQENSNELMHPQSPERYLQNFSKRYGVEHLPPTSAAQMWRVSAKSSAIATSPLRCGFTPMQTGRAANRQVTFSVTR